MTFLLALIFATVAPFIYALGFMKTDQEQYGNQRRFHFAFWAGGIFALTFVYTIFSVNRWSPNDINWTPIGFLTGGLLGVPVFGYLTWRTATVTPKLGRQTLAHGVVIFALVSFAYIGFTAVDHFLFWREKQSGIAHSVMYSKADIPCDAVYIIVRQDGDTYRYRCPHNIILGPIFGEPFVPWPTYSEGESKRLKEIHEEMLRDSDKNRVDRDSAGKVPGNRQ